MIISVTIKESDVKDGIINLDIGFSHNSTLQ